MQQQRPSADRNKSQCIRKTIRRSKRFIPLHKNSVMYHKLMFPPKKHKPEKIKNKKFKKKNKNNVES